HRVALDVLHDDVRHVGGLAARRDDVVLPGVVDGDDRRVVERGGGLRLPPEAGLERGVPGEVGAQHLDRHGAGEPVVVADVDLGHAASTDELADLVAPCEHLGYFVHHYGFLTVSRSAGSVPGAPPAGRSPPRARVPRVSTSTTIRATPTPTAVSQRRSVASSARVGNLQRPGARRRTARRAARAGGGDPTDAAAGRGGAAASC